MVEPASNPPKILFVDDEVQVLTSLRRGLHRFQTGWDVAFTSDATAAVQQAVSSRPDVVVTDLDMPALTGIEMVVEMRRSVPAETVFILLTGAGDLQSAIAAINQARIFRFLTKPCPIDDLVRAIEEGLAWQREETSPDKATPVGLANVALGRLSTAVVVVNRLCQVMYLNESASEIIAAKNGMLIDHSGICRALTAQGSQDLGRLVREAPFGEDEAIRYLSLPTAPERRDLRVMIEAISQEHVALFLADPERIAVPPLEGLQDLFGLTRAEATVARALAMRGSLEEAAAAGGVTVSSARTYLKRVFSKTGVGRQAELIQLLLSTPMAMPRLSSGE